MKQMTILLSLVLFLFGCSVYHIDTHDTSNTFYTAKSSAKDVAYLENIGRSHDVIGVVTINTERRQSGGEVIERLKLEAAKLGGDAITNIETNATGPWKKLPAQKIIGNGYVRANFKASVVTYK